MEQSYIPPRQKQLAWNVVIMVGLVLLGVGLIVLANLSTLIRYASVFVAVAFLLVVPFFMFSINIIKRSKSAILLMMKVCVFIGA